MYKYFIIYEYMKDGFENSGKGCTVYTCEKELTADGFMGMCDEIKHQGEFSKVWITQITPMGKC